MNFKFAAALSTFVLLIGGAARAETIHFVATLTGGDEVPANTTAGTGKVTAELETDEHALTYRATYAGLSGPATAAHFHGPAAPGTNAPPTVPIAVPTSPISGAALLTADQQADLLAGKWYFNVHTAAHTGGEIRGQLKLDRE
jgi:hypothetical protein